MLCSQSAVRTWLFGPHSPCCLHLTLNSCAGKKRQRRVRQPKPLEAYCLDMSAVDFSSSQQMRICELPTAGVNFTVQGHHPLMRVVLNSIGLGMWGAFAEVLSLESIGALPGEHTYPGSGGARVRKRAKAAAMGLEARPGSAPPLLCDAVRNHYSRSAC